MNDETDPYVTRRLPPPDSDEQTAVTPADGTVTQPLPPVPDERTVALPPADAERTVALPADAERTVALPADTSLIGPLPAAASGAAGSGAGGSAAPRFPLHAPPDGPEPPTAKNEQPASQVLPAGAWESAPGGWPPPAADGRSPQGWTQPAAGGYQTPQRTSYSMRRRRRWPVALLVLLVLIPTALGGFALGRVFGSGDATSVPEYAQGSRDAGAGRLPDGAGDTAPRWEQPQDDDPWPGDASGSGAAGSGAAATAGPSGAEVAAIAEAAAPGLVNIETATAYDGGKAAGSGIVLTSSGEVLTNNHVIERAGSIRVTSVGTGRTYDATVLGYDRRHDIALLQLEGADDLPTAQLGSSSAVQVGDAIVVLGNADGDGGAPDAMGGVVSALDRDIVASGPTGEEQLSGLIEVAADVRSGQSGGATVNAEGAVIGVTTAASAGYSFDQAGGSGYAVPIDQALAIVAQIRSGQSEGSVHAGPTAFLGVQVTSAGDGYGQYSVSGAMVAAVLPDTPAEKVGLQAGDIIMAVDGRTVESASGLTALLGAYKPGDTVELVWMNQNGETRSEDVTLASGPPG